MVGLGRQELASHSAAHFFPHGLIALLLGSASALFSLFIAPRLIRNCCARLTGDHASRMSADTVSSSHPDRPIRPLPKRRLRERLSPEVADSIQYPPTPQNTTPLFYYTYSTRDDETEPLSSHGRERFSDRGTSQGRRTGGGAESDEDDFGTRRNAPGRLGADSSGYPQRLPLRQDNGRHSNSQPPLSAASSADGYYDPFEMTNNNKKRKIPTAGDTALNGSHGIHDVVLGADPSATPVQSIEGQGETSPATSTPYYGCGSFASGAQNVSGPGRGRYGRVRNGRSPLRALSDSTNNWAGRNGKLRPSQLPLQTSKLPLPLPSFLLLLLLLLLLFWKFAGSKLWAITVTSLHCLDSFHSFALYLGPCMLISFGRKVKTLELFLMPLPTQRR